MKTRIFISRDASKNERLRSLGSNSEVEWIESSMIKFEHQDFILPYKVELLFFSSPQCILSFYHRYPGIDVPVATMGSGTSGYLPDSAHVIFEGEGNTETVAKEFKRFVASKKILFPIGDKSLGTVQKALSPDQYEEVVCYRTIDNSRTIDPCDVYVFTSPSNVHSFFKLNQIPIQAEVIAMGESSANALREHGKNPIIPIDYSPSGMWKTIFSRLNS